MTEESNDIRMHLLEQWDWAIDAYRSYLNASFPHNTTLTLCAIMFLTIAEMMRLRYARHHLEDLPAGAGGFWHGAFKVMSAIPVGGVIAIRVIEIFMVSQSIVLTVCFAVTSAMLGGIFPVAIHLFRKIRNWMRNSDHEEGDETESSPLQEQTGHFASTQVRLRSMFLESFCKVTSVVIATVAIFLERVIWTAHRQLRTQSRPARGVDDVSLEEILV